MCVQSENLILEENFIFDLDGNHLKSDLKETPFKSWPKMALKSNWIYNWMISEL